MGGVGGVHDPVLTLSKSIAVKTGVPIQVVLEEKGTEPEQSPWGEQLPYPPPQPKRITLSLSQHLPLLALHGRSNEQSNLELPLTSLEEREGWGGVTVGVTGDPIFADDAAVYLGGPHNCKKTENEVRWRECWLWSLL